MIPAALLLALIAFSVRDRNRSFVSPALPEEVRHNDIVIVPKPTSAPSSPRDESQNVQRVLAMRESFKVGADYGAAYVYPMRGPGPTYVFSIDYKPKTLGCKAGDLDLIAKAVPPGESLLLTVDSDSDAKPLVTKEMTPSGLKAPFTLTIKVPTPKDAKVYRITLCSALNGGDTCKGATPAPMSQLAQPTFKGRPDNWIFFAQTFIAEPRGLKILDNLRQDLLTKGVDPGKAFGKKLADSPYLKELPQINARVKPIPTTFADNTLSMTMYYRDREACKALGMAPPGGFK